MPIILSKFANNVHEKLPDLSTYSVDELDDMLRTICKYDYFQAISQIEPLAHGVDYSYRNDAFKYQMMAIGALIKAGARENILTEEPVYLAVGDERNIAREAARYDVYTYFSMALKGEIGGDEEPKAMLVYHFYIDNIYTGGSVSCAKILADYLKNAGEFIIDKVLSTLVRTAVRWSKDFTINRFNDSKSSPYYVSGMDSKKEKYRKEIIEIFAEAFPALFFKQLDTKKDWKMVGNTYALSGLPSVFLRHNINVFEKSPEFVKNILDDMGMTPLQYLKSDSGNIELIKSAAYMHLKKSKQPPYALISKIENPDYHAAIMEASLALTGV